MANSQPSVASSGQEQIGFSLQDTVRFDIWGIYKRVSFYQKEMFTEVAKFRGRVKTKTALEALNELYNFVDEVDLKNNLYYRNSALDDFGKFTNGFYQPALTALVPFRSGNVQFLPAELSQEFVYHFRRWKKLCRYMVEVSGISKFERPKEVSEELAFSKT